MDIVVWLRSLGLGKYEAIFRENDIDETVLPSLTHENLNELCVASFGHRVKLLDAIAALHNDAGGKAPSVDAANRSSAPIAPAPFAESNIDSGDLTLIGVADPLVQNSDAVTVAPARLSQQTIEPPPKPGFSGAAAADARGRLVGMWICGPASSPATARAPLRR